MFLWPEIFFLYKKGAYEEDEYNKGEDKKLIFPPKSESLLLTSWFHDNEIPLKIRGRYAASFY